MYMNTVSKTLGVSLFLVVLVLLTACQPTFEEGASGMPTDFDPAQTVAADTARWVAMGEYYVSLAETARERAVEADAARWVAKGEFYARSNSQDGFDPAQTVAADTARWLAMGEYYANLAETARERAIEADVARWVAMGEYYANLDSAGGSNPAHSADVGAVP